MTVKKNTTLKCALVVEGGGMRGIFPAGVLDVFLEKKFDPFGLYVGVSAGACNLASHLAGQHERNFRIYTQLMTRPGFISLRKFLQGGHLMDLDYLWDLIDDQEPLSLEEIFKHKGKEYVVVGTNANLGIPVYMRTNERNCNECLKASSAVPLLYRGIVEIDSTHYVDGGVTDPIPAMEAYRRGARIITVIRTRPAHFRKKKGIENYISSFATRAWPKLSDAVKAQAETYSRCVDFILNPPNDATIIQIAPETQLRTGRTTQDIGSLLADYKTGRKIGEEFVFRWEQVIGC
ncbi:MAG: patatin family protein [Spirochaetes bacterium]|nr:patatin family protein [Spirochaetota bacterium]